MTPDSLDATADMARAVIVGAGAAGVSAALQLLECAAVAEVVLIDPVPGEGRGVAYGTEDEQHLLNVPAGRMSAHADDPTHFARWLAVEGDEYVPRSRFGSYLADTLTRAARSSAGTMRRVHATVVGIETRAAGVTVRLDHGGCVEADAAVLAIGSFAPSCDWAPAELRRSPRFIADPWRFDEVAEGDVLLVGTGLTMVDTALSLRRPGRIVHAVSRHGWLPQPHAATPPAPCAPPDLPPAPTLAALHQAVLRHVVNTGNWRSAIDSLRPRVAAVWGALPQADKQRFLCRYQRLWDVHRHRIPPTSAGDIDRMRANGELEVTAGDIAAAREVDGGVRVTLATGAVLTVGTVINCTGRHEVVRQDDGLVSELIRRGVASPGPVGLGLDTACDGRVSTGAPVWVIGALRRGNLFETTAYPEIREQASVVAASIFSHSRTARRATDGTAARRGAV